MTDEPATEHAPPRDQKARPEPPNPPGAACQPAPGGPSDLVAVREWTAQDFTDEMAQLRFTIDRVRFIIADEPKGLDPDAVVDYVRLLVDGAKQALPLLARLAPTADGLVTVLFPGIEEALHGSDGQ